jgi:membrane-bound lytic murein transglycosylase B
MHRHRAISVFCLAICLAATRFAGAANAAPNVAPSVAPNTVPCRTGGPYDKWLAEFEREAMAQGVSQQTIAAAAPYLTYDQRIVNIDRGQRVFTQTFLEFSDRMAAAYAGVREDRSAIRRAGAGDRGVLGAGKRFRREYGELSHAERDCLARL